MLDNAPVCFLCGRKSHEIDEYLDAIEGTNLSAEEYVRREEGTYNRRSGLFCCTSCYLAIGCPTSRSRWTAPDVEGPSPCPLCRQVAFSQYVELVDNGIGLEERPINGGMCTTCGVLERDPVTDTWTRYVARKPVSEPGEGEGAVAR